jgi:hypothetical protein
VPNFELQPGEKEIWRFGPVGAPRVGLGTYLTYVITDKRAIIIKGRKADKLLDSRFLEQCALAVTQKKEVDLAYWRKSAKDVFLQSFSSVRPGDRFVTVGTLMFITGDKQPLVFESIEDPDGVAKLVREITK